MEDQDMVVVTTFTVVMDAKPDDRLPVTLGWLIAGIAKPRRTFARVDVGHPVEMSDPELWAFPVTVISRGELGISDVLALRALIKGSARKDVVVSNDRKVSLTLESLMPPPPPPLARVAEYHLVSAARDPKTVLDWLSAVGNDGAPESVGIEIVGYDWRDRVLISRTDRSEGQVNLGVRVKPTEPGYALRGLRGAEFRAYWDRASKLDLIERLRAVALEGHNGSKDDSLETARRYTWIYPPESYAPEPDEEKVVTTWITYGRAQFLRDVALGKTHWFLQGSGGKLAVMRVEENGQMIFAATRRGSTGDFLFVQMPISIMTEAAKAKKMTVFKLLVEETDSGFRLSREDVTRRTGLLFV